MMIDQKKIDTALLKLRTFEPEEGYYVAFSGGKDSQCVYHLCKMAGVKFDAHYRVTSVDPPELVRFIRGHYPDVSREIPYDAAGNPITMWNLIPHVGKPPTRNARYCCADLKESGGQGRVTITGVRWAESPRRAAMHGSVEILQQPARAKRIAMTRGIDIREGSNGSVILNDDNDLSRRMVEVCYRTMKTLVNPIVDWSTEDVWSFLNDVAQVPHCCLYDEGYSRLGCIGCPMSSIKNRQRDFERYPKYKEAYLRAFDRMLKARDARGLPNDLWSSPEEVMTWYLSA